jgi:NAD(P)-dependent dehydrogenase (short-subunit alcohol dehydrogenase family)
MTARLNGKVALITGGTSGIGEATVELFAREGARVVFTGRNAAKGGEIAARLGATVRFVAGDVRHEADIKVAIDTAVSEFGALDCLFNNAGGPAPGSLEGVTGEEFRHAMDLLVGSALFGIKHAAPIMKRQGRGAIINNASVAAARTHMGEYLYSMAKAAVVQMTRLAGMELGPHGVTVNSISPGGIATPIFFGGSQQALTMDEAHVKAKMEKLERNLASATPLHRSGVPLDIAYGALYLASDDARYVNCHDLVIDAGMTAAGRNQFTN